MTEPPIFKSSVMRYCELGQDMNIKHPCSPIVKRVDYDMIEQEFKIIFLSNAQDASALKSEGRTLLVKPL